MKGERGRKWNSNKLRDENIGRDKKRKTSGKNGWEDWEGKVGDKKKNQRKIWINLQNLFNQVYLLLVTTKHNPIVFFSKRKQVP